MKLDGFARIALVATALTAGCASRPTPAPLAPTVGTTELTAADLTDGRPEGAPKVSKSHRAEPAAGAVDIDGSGPKPAARRNDRRPGSGFSGYK